MSKYWRIYKIYFSNSFSYFAQYRKDFFFNIFINFVWIGILFLTVEIVFSQTQTIVGWDKEQVYLLTMFWVIADEIFVLFFGGNLFSIPDYVTEGVIDFYLVKPASTLFLISTKYILFRGVARLLGELGILIWVLYNFSYSFSVSSWLWAIILLLLGIVAQFAIVLILNTLSFWYMRIDNINDAMGVMSIVGRYPLDVFNRFFKIIFLSIMPVALFAYVPTATLFGKWPWYGILYAVLVSCLLFILALAFWRYALKKYSSASS